MRMKDRALTMAVVITTVVVIVLAVLQYNWSNEVSEATGVRLADTLQLSMINWHQDLLRNFSEVAVTMRMDPESDERGDLSQYAKRFAEWRTVARYPDFVSNVYFFDSKPPDRAEALRLDPGTRQLQPVSGRCSFRARVPGIAARPPDAGCRGESHEAARASIRDSATPCGWRFEPSIPRAASHRARWGCWKTTDRHRTERCRDREDSAGPAHRYFQGTDGLTIRLRSWPAMAAAAR